MLIRWKQWFRELEDLKKTHLFKMRLNAAERESIRKRLEIFFVKNPKIKNSKIANHFEKERIARNTIYDNLKRLQTGQFFLVKSVLVVRHPGLEKTKAN